MVTIVFFYLSFVTTFFLIIQRNNWQVDNLLRYENFSAEVGRGRAKRIGVDYRPRYRPLDLVVRETNRI